MRVIGRLRVVPWARSARVAQAGDRRIVRRAAMSRG